MLSSLLLIGGIGSTELLLLLALPLLLGLGLLWRLLRPAKPAVVVHTAPARPSVADELRKLEELRDRGTLTPEEFAAQKARLLQ